MTVSDAQRTTVRPGPPPAPATPAAPRRRWRERLPAELSYRPFLLLIAAGIAVRLALMALYFPAVMLSFDSVRFARIHPEPLFSDFWMPAGYAVFAKYMREITHELWITIAVQHVLGLLAATAIYLAMRRLGARAWVACLPAAAVLLSGDVLYLEHIIMADVFLLVLATLGLASAVRGLVPRVDPRWLAAAGVLLAGAGLSRSVGLVLLPVLLVCVLFWTRGRARARAVAAAAVPAAVVFALYIGAWAVKDGQYLGFTDMSGWNLYSRVAPFAECNRFDPPRETRPVCERSDPDDRAGPYFYVWDEGSISRRAFQPLGPQTGEPLGEFAREAIVNQPLDYLSAVAIDLARYVEPSVGRPRGYSGQPRELIWFGWRDPQVERTVVNGMSQGYGGTEVRLRAQDLLGAYQNLFRVGGLLLAGLVLLTLIGMIVARGPTRLGVFLFGLSGLALYILPTLTVSYDFRYGIPPSMLIAASGVLGASALLARRARRT